MLFSYFVLFDAKMKGSGIFYFLPFLFFSHSASNTTLWQKLSDAAEQDACLLISQPSGDYC